MWSGRAKPCCALPSRLAAPFQGSACRCAEALHLPQQSHAIAVRKVLKAHPDYDRLRKLKRSLNYYLTKVNPPQQQRHEVLMAPWEAMS